MTVSDSKYRAIVCETFICIISLATFLHRHAQINCHNSHNETSMTSGNVLPAPIKVRAEFVSRAVMQRRANKFENILSNFATPDTIICCFGYLKLQYVLLSQNWHSIRNRLFVLY